MVSDCLAYLNPLALFHKSLDPRFLHVRKISQIKDNNNFFKNNNNNKKGVHDAGTTPRLKRDGLKGREYQKVSVRGSKGPTCSPVVRLVKP